MIDFADLRGTPPALMVAQAVRQHLLPAARAFVQEGLPGAARRGDLRAGCEKLVMLMGFKDRTARASRVYSTSKILGVGFRTSALTTLKAVVR